jgi:hypothetical protein
VREALRTASIELRAKTDALRPLQSKLRDLSDEVCVPFCACAYVHPPGARLLRARAGGGTHTTAHALGAP